jgi:hypothetical protein
VVFHECTGTAIFDRVIEAARDAADAESTRLGHQAACASNDEGLQAACDALGLVAEFCAAAMAARRRGTTGELLGVLTALAGCAE